MKQQQQSVKVGTDQPQTPIRQEGRAHGHTSEHPSDPVLVLLPRIRSHRLCIQLTKSLYPSLRRKLARSWSVWILLQSWVADISVVVVNGSGWL